MIAGLAAPQEGEIRIGGVVLQDETATSLRARMRWVGQRPHIFAGSARHNITLGRDADAEKTASIINQMALSHVAGITGTGVIGENGAGLSGGEALRLALARIAVDQDADIILADEPTAHLDHETADRIADTLISLAKGKTLIISTHDEKLASRMDRIVRLDDLSGEAQVWQKRAAE
ncbi:Protein glycosylation K [compost metagenome]